MKKVFGVVLLVFFMVGCGKEVSVIGTWTSSDGNTYVFHDNGECEKTSDKSYECTYTQEKGVVNIYLTTDPENIYESGQINPERIIIGSDVYEKGE